MKRRVWMLLTVAATCAMLSGCCINHAWQEATCTAPRTCAKCGKTEGEVLPHTWVEATCTEPKHCSVCGTTEGEALGHTLTEANYQQAATCEVCGETVGEPLQADFEKEKISCDAELGQTYTSVEPCYDNPEYTTTVKVIFSDYSTFASDETHEALDGYEWQTATLTYVVDDENGYNYGFSIKGFYADDYYNREAVPDEFGENYTINYNGVDYDECVGYSEEESSGWVNNVYTIKHILTFRVPEGYDGRVIRVPSDGTRDDIEYEDYDINFRLQ